MKTSGVESAIEEMDYEIVENCAGIEMPLSKPAAFRVDPQAELNQDALKEALESKDMGMFAEYVNHNDETGRWYFKFEVYGHEYKRIQAKMWPDALRVYPRENQPDVPELAQITSAIEQSMDCTLHHDPIDDD